MPLVNDYIQQVQDNGIVELRVGSERISNIVLVRKRDGSLHYCIDYRGLNAATLKANCPLPHINTFHDSLGGNTFSSFDVLWLLAGPRERGGCGQDVLCDEKGHLRV